MSVEVRYKRYLYRTLYPGLCTFVESAGGDTRTRYRLDDWSCISLRGFSRRSETNPALV